MKGLPFAQIPAPMEAIETQSIAKNSANFDSIQALGQSIIFCSEEEEASHLWDLVEVLPIAQQEQLKLTVGAIVWDKFLSLLPF